MRRLRRADPQRVWRVAVEPGEEVQVDLGTGARVIEPQSGRRRRPWVLRVALSFSRKAYGEAFFRQDTEHFIRGLENASRAFGGVVRVVNLDNLKAAVGALPASHGRLDPLRRFAMSQSVFVGPAANGGAVEVELAKAMHLGSGEGIGGWWLGGEALAQ